MAAITNQTKTVILMLLNHEISECAYKLSRKRIPANDTNDYYKQYRDKLAFARYEIEHIGVKS